MNDTGKVRVLLVEDSPSQRETLAWIIRESDDLVLAGEATNGVEAVEKARTIRPDVILMDCHLPILDGIAATRAIMQECPCPIVMASASLATDDVHPGLEALREGALVIVAKPLDPMAPNFDALCRELRLSLRLMSEIRVVRRVPPRQAAPRKRPARRVAIVAIGASTGGPPVILDLLRRLAPDLDVPIVVVQHMAPGFVTGFASWLERGSGLPVVLAGDGDAVRPSHVYVAPEHRHVEVDGRGRISLDDGPAEGGFRPSINRLFRSVGEAYGPAAIAVLLTGMGDDGAEGMAVVARHGGITVAQDAETSVVFGMPAAAVRLGAVQHLLPPAEIARFVAEQVSRKSLST